MTNYYVDGAEWCVLVNKNFPDVLEQSSRKRRFGEAFYLWAECVFHIEPIERYRCEPPGNRDLKLYKTGLTKQEAYEFLGSEEALEIKLHILEENGIRLNLKNDNPDSVSLGRRFDVFRRDGFKCCICGRSAEDGVKLEVDHRYPRSRGGGNSMSNLWTLCFACNRGKKAKFMDEQHN